MLALLVACAPEYTIDRIPPACAFDAAGRAYCASPPMDYASATALCAGYGWGLVDPTERDEDLLRALDALGNGAWCAWPQDFTRADACPALRAVGDVVPATCSWELPFVCEPLTM